MPRNPALSETLSCFFDAEGNIPAGDRDAFRGLERAGIHAGGKLKSFPTDSATENRPPVWDFKVEISNEQG